MIKKILAVVFSVLLLSGTVPFIPCASPVTSYAETTDLEEAGAAIRKKLEVKVCDVIYLNDKAYLYDAEGNERRAGSGWRMWIIGADDENQRFRVDVPKMREEGNSVFYLLYADTEDAIGVSHNGYVVGDLNYDKRVDVFDLCLMKQYFIDGWEKPELKVLADMNSDNQVTMSDLVWLQKWLLGIPKPAATDETETDPPEPEVTLHGYLDMAKDTGVTAETLSSYKSPLDFHYVGDDLSDVRWDLLTHEGITVSDASVASTTVWYPGTKSPNIIIAAFSAGRTEITYTIGKTTVILEVNVYDPSA